MLPVKQTGKTTKPRIRMTATRTLLREARGGLASLAAGAGVTVSARAKGLSVSAEKRSHGSSPAPLRFGGGGATIGLAVAVAVAPTGDRPNGSVVERATRAANCDGTFTGPEPGAAAARTSEA